MLRDKMGVVNCATTPAYNLFKKTNNKTTMYVSRGLGNSVIPIRLFNRPEIVCIDIEVED